MSQTEVQLIKDAVIVNADVSGSAAIDVSKISGAMPLAGGSFTDDVTFTGANYNAFWDKSANKLKFNDNAVAGFGTNVDLEIKHDGSNSKLTHAGAGGLYIGADTFALQKGDHSENYIAMSANGAVELYYDSSKKLETTSTGVALTGNLELGDNERIVLGDAGTSDSHIRWDTSHLQIASAGLARFSCSGLSVVNLAGNETQLTTTENGSVELYHNNVKQVQTTADGFGFINNCTFSDNKKIKMGDANDLQIYHQGSHSYIQDAGTGSLILVSNQAVMQNAGQTENMFAAVENGANNLYYDNVVRFSTASNGVSVVGRQTVQSNNDAVNSLLQTTNSGGAYIQHATGASGATIAYTGHSSQLCLSPTVGNYAIRFEGAALEFAQSNSIKARITTHGGIAFGSDTAAANTLSDYEEGSWTPDFQNRTSTAPSTQEGRYRKIGNQVFAYLHINYHVSLVTSNGLVNISGLPFTASSGHSVYGAATSIHMNNSFVVGDDEAFLNALVPPNNNIANVYFRSGGNNAHLPASRMGTGNFLTCLIYFTD